MVDKPQESAAKSELQCFLELERLRLLDPTWDQFYSPYKAKHSHYSLRLAAHHRGHKQPPGGPTAL